MLTDLSNTDGTAGQVPLLMVVVILVLLTSLVLVLFQHEVFAGDGTSINFTLSTTHKMLNP